MKLRIKAFGHLPTRLLVGVMMFFVAFFNYMLRVNMSVNIIAMVPAKANTTTIKSECAALAANASGWDFDESSIAMASRQAREPVVFEWTEQQQAYILSSYFWSYAVTALLGGLVAERWGSTRLIFGTSLIAAVTTILSPQAAKLHYSALIVARLIVGFTSGLQYPALHWLVARWAPPDEKGLFVSALVGGAIGTVVTWSLTGPLIEGFGWEYAFYIPGLIVFAWSFLWWYLISDSPVQHPRISERERKYILDAIGDKVEQKQNVKIVVPLKSVLTSGPFIACMVLHFGTLWGVYFVMTAAPKYLSTALGFNLTSTGGLSSLPYLARMLFSMLFGVIGDIILKKKWMSTTFMRKFFCIFSHIIPGILLASLGYAGCSAALSVTILTAALGSNGAAVLTNLVNTHDLAPNYAASLYGISNGITNFAGFFTPLVTASFTKNGNGFAEWRPVFLIGASCYFVTAIYFILFGTGETQKWNHIPNDEENNK